MALLAKVYEQFMDSCLTQSGYTCCAKLHVAEAMIEISLAICLVTATQPQTVLAGAFGSMFLLPLVLDIARLAFVLAAVLGGRCDPCRFSLCEGITLMICPQFLVSLWVVFCLSMLHTGHLGHDSAGLCFHALLLPRIVFVGFILMIVRREVRQSVLPTTVNSFKDVGEDTFKTREKTLQDLTLDTFTVGMEAACVEEDDKCMICLEQFVPEEVVSVLHCQHKFHATCIEDWIYSSCNGGGLCPMRCEPPFTNSNANTFEQATDSPAEFATVDEQPAQADIAEFSGVAQHASSCILRI